jgi:hypothetical protein
MVACSSGSSTRPSPASATEGGRGQSAGQQPAARPAVAPRAAAMRALKASTELLLDPGPRKSCPVGERVHPEHPLGALAAGHEPHVPRVIVLPDVDVVGVQLADPGASLAAESSFHRDDRTGCDTRMTRSVVVSPGVPSSTPHSSLDQDQPCRMRQAMAIAFSMFSYLPCLQLRAPRRYCSIRSPSSALALDAGVGLSRGTRSSRPCARGFPVR